MEGFRFSVAAFVTLLLIVFICIHFAQEIPLTILEYRLAFWSRLAVDAGENENELQLQLIRLRILRIRMFMLRLKVKLELRNLIHGDSDFG